MNEKTAVEWLINELLENYFLEKYPKQIFEKALALEKQRWIDAYSLGFKECENTHENTFFIQDLAEKEFNKLFKNKSHEE